MMKASLLRVMMIPLIVAATGSLVLVRVRLSLLVMLLN